MITMTVMIMMVIIRRIKVMGTSVDTITILTIVVMTASRSGQEVTHSFLSSFSFWLFAAKQRRGAERGEVSARKRVTTVTGIEQKNEIVTGTGLGKKIEIGRETGRESEMVGRIENEMEDAKGNRIAGGKSVREIEMGARIRSEGKGEREIGARRGKGGVTDKKKEGETGREGVRDAAVSINKG